MNSKKLKLFFVDNMIWLILLGVFLFFGIIKPRTFLTFQNVHFILYVSSMMGFLVFAETICLLSGNFDLSIGEIAGFSAMVDLALFPDKVKEFAIRCTDFMLGIAERQIELAKPVGMVIWGDVAYDKGMFFSPRLWQDIYFPCVKRICDFLHEKDLIIVYHGCGRSLEIMENLIEAGIDAYNPLEAKAGMDPVELKKEFGDRLSFWGGIDTRLLGYGTWEEIEKEALYKLQTARGGGYMPASDHSVASNVDPLIYDRLISLLKEKGKYPIEPIA